MRKYHFSTPTAFPQVAGTFEKAAGDERGRTARSSGNRRHAGQTPAGGRRRIRADRIQGKRVGGEAQTIGAAFNGAFFRLM